MDAQPISALSSSDIVIAVMGITGSGKSTLINLLADDDVRIGHSLRSCTAEVQIHSFVYKNTQRVYLIDTPGFDDTNRTDTDVLKDVAFLSQTYRQTVHLTGIIYLHRITDDRMSGSSIRNLTMFKKLCGEDAYRHVVLATTMWAHLTGTGLSIDTGIGRERELIQTREWWGLMHERGSTVVRHSGDKDSARAIVAQLIALNDRDGPVVLDIQREMVTEDKSLEDTAAGQEFGKELQKARETFQRQIRDLQGDYNQALKDRDTQLADALAQQRTDMEQKLEKADKAREDLRISLDKLAEEKAGEYNELLRQLEDEQKRSEERIDRQKEEYQQLQSQREEDAKRQEAFHAQYNQQLQAADQQLKDSLRLRDEQAAEQVRAEKKRLAVYKKQMDEKFAREQADQRRKDEELRAQIIQAQEAKQKRSGVMPLLLGLTGLGMTAAGALTLNPALVAAGATMMGAADDGS